MKEDTLSSLGPVKVLGMQPETCGGGGESVGIHQHFSDMLSLGLLPLSHSLWLNEILLPRVCVQLKVSLVQI